MKHIGKMLAIAAALVMGIATVMPVYAAKFYSEGSGDALTQN